VSVSTNSEVRAQLLAVLDDFEIEHDGVTDETLLRADLDIDSAELVEIVAAVVGHRTPDGKALKDVQTIGALVAFLQVLDD
jgi:acyl carrier protein